MGCNKKTLGGCIVMAMALLVSSCTSTSSGQVATETGTPPTPTATAIETATPAVDAPTATPTEVPTPTPAELSDDEMIAGARAVFDADPKPSTLMAWDHTGATVSGTTVQLEVCSWTGDTVFDDVRVAAYKVTNTDDGVDVDYLFDSSIQGNCLNTDLIDSALAATRDYDTFWGAVLEDPTTFDRDQAANYVAIEQLDVAVELAAGWNADEVRWRGHALDGALPGSSLQPIAGRRYLRDDDLKLLEVISCRALPPDYGLYRDDLLVDDYKGSASTGTHAIHKYQLTSVEGRWLVAGVGSTVWADCFASDWLSGLNEWQPDPVEWELVR